MVKILLIDFFEQELLNALKIQGYEYEYLPKITRSELLKGLWYHEVLLLKSKTFVDEELLNSFNGLLYVIRAGAGVEHIDEQALNKRKIQLLTTNAGNCNAVAEQAVGMLLSLTHNISKAHNEVKQFIWQREPNRGTEIEGKTVGIIGFGHTGSHFAQKLMGFQCNILAYDKYKSGFSNAYVQETDLITIQKQADIVSFHVPLTVETYHYLNEEFIQSMKKPFWLLNLSRGGVVDIAILPKYLENGKIKGAALDVLENEDFHSLTDNEKQLYEKLFSYSNVIVTPHIGGLTHESNTKIQQLILKHLNNIRLAVST